MVWRRNRSFILINLYPLQLCKILLGMGGIASHTYLIVCFVLADNGHNWEVVTSEEHSMGPLRLPTDPTYIPSLMYRTLRMYGVQPL